MSARQRAAHRKMAAGFGNPWPERAEKAARRIAAVEERWRLIHEAIDELARVVQTSMVPDYIFISPESADAFFGPGWRETFPVVLEDAA